MHPGWIPAVCRGACNWAYDDSMASSYDRLGHPAVVVVKGEETTTVLRRQTLKMNLDVWPSYVA